MVHIVIHSFMRGKREGVKVKITVSIFSSRPVEGDKHGEIIVVGG